MAKRKDTLELEQALIQHMQVKGEYGCEEVTIGFYHSGHGDEIADFVKMNSKGVIRCYEIKVTLQDLKSKAKKSWYGHYNYLVVSECLYEQVNDWNKYIPDYVGIISGSQLTNRRNAKRCNVSIEAELMIKESLVRSLYYKMEKFRDAQSIQRHRENQAEIRRLRKERNEYSRRATRAENIIGEYECYKACNDGVEEISLLELVKVEKQKFRSARKK